MQPGSPAPSFTAAAYYSATKTLVDVELASHKGSYTVLLFYSGDFGPLMLADFMGFLVIEELGELLENDLNMLAISTDSVESHRAFAELKQEEGGLQGLECSLVEDKTGKICKD